MNSLKKRFFRLLWLVLLLVGTDPCRRVEAASAALEQLQTNIASLQRILTDPKLAGDEHLSQRRQLERSVLNEIFDFQEMSRRSLGRHARTYADRLTEFTPLFVDFLEHAYMGLLEENGDAKIQYLKEVASGGNVEVRTKTKIKDGSEHTVDYRLFQSGPGWRAYDIVVDDISLVNNYRSQFDRVLNKKSFDDLLQELREKKSSFN